MQTDFFGNNTKILTVAELTRAIRGRWRRGSARLGFFVIPSEAEESLTYFSSKFRDVSTALDMTEKMVRWRGTTT
ncbi:MAG TPA: hypothetical protein VJR49_01415, partial [Chthoniobacterales bacterium]|nr:hypothetical protein [Chthoniobacterales bacterium]